MSRRFLAPRVGGQASAVPVATRMLFDQQNAPTGWTRDTSQNDRLFRIVSGALADGGTWTIGGYTTGAHTLTTAQLAAHTHSDCVLCGGPSSMPGVLNINSCTSGATGGGGSHNHGVSSDASWRPLHRDSIVASLDG